MRSLSDGAFARSIYLPTFNLLRNPQFVYRPDYQLSFQYFDGDTKKLQKGDFGMPRQVHAPCKVVKHVHERG